MVESTDLGSAPGGRPSVSNLGTIPGFVNDVNIIMRKLKSSRTPIHTGIILLVEEEISSKNDGMRRSLTTTKEVSKYREKEISVPFHCGPITIRPPHNIVQLPAFVLFVKYFETREFREKKKLNFRFPGSRFFSSFS